MNLFAYIVSFLPTLIGCTAGLLYGCSFILQHHGLLTAQSTKNRAQSFAFFFIRVGILYFIGRYLLQAPLIPSILGSLGFFGMFWLIILQVKARSYERT